MLFVNSFCIYSWFEHFKLVDNICILTKWSGWENKLVLHVYWLPSFPCSWTKYTNAQFVSAQQDLIRFHIYYWYVFARITMWHTQVCKSSCFFGREPSPSSSVSLVKYWLVDIGYYSCELIKFPRPPPSAFASCMQTGPWWRPGSMFKGEHTCGILKQAIFIWCYLGSKVIPSIPVGLWHHQTDLREASSLLKFVLNTKTKRLKGVM